MNLMTGQLWPTGPTLGSTATDCRETQRENKEPIIKNISSIKKSAFISGNSLITLKNECLKVRHNVPSYCVF